MRSKDILHSPRAEELKRAQRVKTRKKVILFAICFLVLVGGLAALSRLDALQIDTVAISGTEVLEEKQIRAVVEEELAGTYVWLFSRANTFIYPKNTIERKLRDTFKIISELEISHPEIKKIHISIQERKGEYLWCTGGAEGISAENTNCYFLNADGYIFSNAPYFSGNVYFKFLGGGISDDPIGKQFLTPAKFNALIQLKKTMYALKLNPSGVEILDNGEYHFILVRSNGQRSNPPKVLIPADFNYEKIVSNLDSALDADPLKAQLSKGFPTLQYIDMRFDNKVFYK